MPQFSHSPRDESTVDDDDDCNGDGRDDDDGDDDSTCRNIGDFTSTKTLLFNFNMQENVYKSREK